MAIRGVAISTVMVISYIMAIIVAVSIISTP